MAKKSFVTKRTWPVPEHKRRGRSRQLHVQKQKPEIVSLKVRQRIIDFEATESGLTDFLKSFLCEKGVFYKRIGRKLGQITFPKCLLNKIKKYYERIRKTAYQVLRIPHLDLNPV